MYKKRFVRVEKINNIWWFILPENKPFISKGVTTVRFAQDTIQNTDFSPYAENNLKKYGSKEKWAKNALKRLFNWNFNTLAAWSEKEFSDIEVDGKKMFYTPILNIGAAFVEIKQKDEDAWLHGIFPDVFDKDFEEISYEIAKKECSPLKDDERILGYFIDNELKFGPDWRGSDELLTMFLNLPPGSAGKIYAVNFLKKRYSSIDMFNEVWNSSFSSFDELFSASDIKPPFVFPALYEQNQGVERYKNETDKKRSLFISDCDTFAGIIAERYFSVTDRAIKNYDSNHLNLGCRFAYVPQVQVRQNAGKYLDVISFNCYTFDPSDAIDSYSVYDKPCLIGEFSFRGDDSGLPNTRGAGPRVPSQKDRADSFENYVTKALKKPALVGYHWFEHADEPKEGRFDGENSNYGLVNIEDVVYEELTQRMTQINLKAEELHT